MLEDDLQTAAPDDDGDLAAFVEREHEPAASYEAFLALLKANGTL